MKEKSVNTETDHKMTGNFKWEFHHTGLPSRKKKLWI